MRGSKYSFKNIIAFTEHPSVNPPVIANSIAANGPSSYGKKTIIIILSENSTIPMRAKKFAIFWVFSFFSITESASTSSKKPVSATSIYTGYSFISDSSLSSSGTGTTHELVVSSGTRVIGQIFWQVLSGFR
jgi:hypothetical protein